MSTTTTTTTTQKKAPKLLFLSEFLDSLNLTKPERSYYWKHNVVLQSEQKTIVDWNKEIKIKK